MPTSEPRAVFEAFLSAVNSRNTAALDALVHPDYLENHVRNLTAAVPGQPRMVGSYGDAPV